MNDFLSRPKRKYSVDLAGHLAECELNYVRLVHMLPGLRDGRDQWSFNAGSGVQIQVLIELKESAPYTSVVEVQQQRLGVELPRLLLRLCHDADVAEVIAWDAHRHWQSTYEYPNAKMYQPDEKLALNRFLGDWLEFCRKHGLVPPDICDSVLVSGKS